MVCADAKRRRVAPLSRLEDELIALSLAAAEHFGASPDEIAWQWRAQGYAVTAPRVRAWLAAAWAEDEARVLN